MAANDERHPMHVPEAERYACGKGRFGVQVARRGWALLLVALAVVAIGIVLSIAG
jgi:hypothetical protein